MFICLIGEIGRETEFNTVLFIIELLPNLSFCLDRICKDDIIYFIYFLLEVKIVSCYKIQWNQFHYMK